jgi:hypothetical protein
LYYEDDGRHEEKSMKESQRKKEQVYMTQSSDEMGL